MLSSVAVVWFGFLVVVLAAFVLYAVRDLSRCDICQQPWGARKYILGHEVHGEDIFLMAHNRCLVDVKKNPHDFSNVAVESADRIFRHLKKNKERQEECAKETDEAR